MRTACAQGDTGATHPAVSQQKGGVPFHRVTLMDVVLFPLHMYTYMVHYK